MSSMYRKPSEELRSLLENLIMVLFQDVDEVKGRIGETTARSIVEFVHGAVLKAKNKHNWLDYSFGERYTFVTQVLGKLVREKKLLSFRRGNKTIYQIYHQDFFPEKGTRRIPYHQNTKALTHHGNV